MQWTNAGSETEMQLEFTPNSCKLAEPGHRVSDLTSAQLKRAPNWNFTRINAEQRSPMERRFCKTETDESGQKEV